ncbi:MAG TPA: hypothetical protein VKK79_17130 [Candidatus Lokiarchaeia archaeon]|nr:hypothetical protein [Candidatus Lokiarchaeia archaeon]
MLVETYISSIYPRMQETIVATRQYALKRSAVTEEDLANVFLQDTKNAIETQLNSGLDYITDGSVNWLDPIRPVAKFITGIETGANYARWYDTNSFYKKPNIFSKVEVKEDPSIDQYFQPEQLPRGRMKAHLPDPYTIAELSSNNFYTNQEELVLDIAIALSKIVAILEQSGFQFIQLDAPQVVYDKYRGKEKADKNRIDLLTQSVDEVFKHTSGKKSYHTYFGNLACIFPEVLDLPVDLIGVDFINTPLSELEDYQFTKGLEIGFIDGESTYIETVDETTNFVRSLLETLNPPNITLTTNTDLKYLPRKIADLKVNTLGSIKEELVYADI